MRCQMTVRGSGQAYSSQCNARECLFLRAAVVLWPFPSLSQEDVFWGTGSGPDAHS